MSIVEDSRQESSVMSPKVFFDHACPRLLASRKSRSADRAGVCAVRLRGAGGGNWTIDLARASVVPGLQPNADLELGMKTADFEAMLQGTLDAGGAYAAGRVQIKGNVGLLAEIAELFTDYAL